MTDETTDEIEPPPNSLHLATQIACCRWAPICPPPADEKDGPGAVIPLAGTAASACDGNEPS
jgi:hypothetical protein